MNDSFTKENIQSIIDFFETESLYATFSPLGLAALSLRPREHAQHIDLNQAHNAKDPNFIHLLQETLVFLNTGSHTMPLDFSVFTDFQRRVFDMVRTISPGNLATYKEVAMQIGSPGAAQAVGGAMSKNPVAYFLQTHRVLPAKGIGICKSGAGRFREKLLAHEGHDIAKLMGTHVCAGLHCNQDSRHWF